MSTENGPADGPRAENSVPKRKRWWESQLALLITGALLTGMLVPVFQKVQDSLIWRRQNRYDEVQTRLKSIRECAQEFSYLPADLAEAYERVRTFVTSGSERESAELHSRLIEIQTRRYARNARITSLFVFFSDPVSLRADFRKYDALNSEIMKQLVNAAAKGHSDSARGALDNLDNTILQSTDMFDRIILTMKNEMEGVSHEAGSYQ